MTESRIASRYAKSLVQLCQDKGLLEVVKSDIFDFAATCKSSRDLVLMLHNPILNDAKRESVLKAIFGSSFNQLTISFFELVIRKKRSSILVNTAAEFIKLYNQVKGIQEATLTTSVEIDETAKNRFLGIVKDISKKSIIELTHKVDPSVIGGFVLRIDDQQIDDSVSSQLKKLKIELTSSN